MIMKGSLLQRVLKSSRSWGGGTDGDRGCSRVVPDKPVTNTEAFTARNALPSVNESEALRSPQVHNTVMRGYVGVTDYEWYRFLAARPEISEAEVNFWRPGGAREFRALTVGEPFFFKTHSPHNRVVGGGFYSGFAPPPGFASNIVQGKSYDFSEPQAFAYFGDLMQLVLGRKIEIDLSQPWHDAGPVFGDPRLAPYRLAQQAFKAVVLNSYRGHCAITGTKIRPVLQAAHIRPVAEGGENRIDNGLLLRSDVHTMFDNGYLAVDPSYRLRVSPRLRGEFGNGEQFYTQAGQVIALPTRRIDRPHREFLEWHLDEVFKAS
jgi:hypothetical protein